LIKVPCGAGVKTILCVSRRGSLLEDADNEPEPRG
jgi:hypothetical protein